MLSAEEVSAELCPHLRAAGHVRGTLLPGISGGQDSVALDGLLLVVKLPVELDKLAVCGAHFLHITVRIRATISLSNNLIEVAKVPAD